MSRVLGALVAAAALVAVTGCATPTPPTPASPSPGQSPERAAPSASPASDACANLTGDDVRAAINALPGWSYDFWSTDGGPIGGPPPLHLSGEVEYVAPDRLRVVGWDFRPIRHGQIIIGDRVWSYAGLPQSSPPDSSLAESSPFSPAAFATMLESVFPVGGTFPFRGDLPGDGLRESPRVADTECLATDPDTGTSLVTTRSGQLVRMNGELGRIIFNAAMPRPIEPPTVADLKTELIEPIPARPLATDPLARLPRSRPR